MSTPRGHRRVDLGIPLPQPAAMPPPPPQPEGWTDGQFDEPPPGPPLSRAERYLAFVAQPNLPRWRPPAGVASQPAVAPQTRPVGVTPGSPQQTSPRVVASKPVAAPYVAGEPRPQLHQLRPLTTLVPGPPQPPQVQPPRWEPQPEPESWGPPPSKPPAPLPTAVASQPVCVAGKQPPPGLGPPVKLWPTRMPAVVASTPVYVAGKPPPPGCGPPAKLLHTPMPAVVASTPVVGKPMGYKPPPPWLQATARPAKFRVAIPSAPAAAASVPAFSPRSRLILSGLGLAADGSGPFPPPSVTLHHGPPPLMTPAEAADAADAAPSAAASWLVAGMRAKIAGEP